MSGINRTEIALNLLDVATKMFNDVHQSTFIEEGLLDANMLIDQDIAAKISSAEFKIATKLRTTAKKIINSTKSG
jgi:hypothetical protein